MLNLTPADMAPVTNTQPWDAIAQKPIKMEPADEGNISKDQSSGFYSEGFHSASPSSSSKDSNGNSPRSVGSANDPLIPANYYETMTLKAKANLGVHLESYHNNVPYNLYVQHELQKKLFQDSDQPTYSSNSPRSLAPPAQVLTPKARSNISPPSSPGPPSSLDGDQKQGFERFNDSGLEVNRTKADGDDGSGGEGSGIDDDFDNEPGLRTPVVNSHGKVKTFRCKQCDFYAVTKLSFWEHSKAHIKPEKMLTCRKCPFVTEYKHHLEYHMRNHSGSKPFRCPQCTYSCVNKSMLNSHLKSHSNVYQYRCSDCNYATKYCHSLKLHLRKYKHNPAMVLNIDGTPNPLPIIDVYGTRRGPKQKSVAKVYEDQMMVNNKLQTPPNPHAIFGNHFPVNIPYLPPLIPHQFLFQPNNKYDNRATDETVKSIEHQPNIIAQSILQNRLSCGENNSSTSPPVKSPENLPHGPTQYPVSSPSTDDALDLRNNKIDEACSPPPQERSTSVTPTTSKNRRKGKAFKLQPAELQLQHENSKTEVNDFDGGSQAMAEPPTSSPVASYTCEFCNITFGDLTMHTIHMGFHGYNDPFMCNKCGERSADRVAFFIHLGRVQHA